MEVGRSFRARLFSGGSNFQEGAKCFPPKKYLPHSSVLFILKLIISHALHFLRCKYGCILCSFHLLSHHHSWPHRCSLLAVVVVVIGGPSCDFLESN